MSAYPSGPRDNTLVQVWSDKTGAIGQAVVIREIFLITSGPSERNVSDRPTSKVSDPVLVTASASLDARRGALVLVIALFVGFCVLTPFARVPMPRLEALIPIFDVIFALITLGTASLLLVAFRRSRMRAVLCLASGYLFTSLIAVPLMLLSSSGPLNADQQTSAWLDTFRNAGLPLVVIGYALTRRYEIANGSSYTGTRADVTWAAAGTVAVVCLLSLFASAGHQLLPRLMLGYSYGSVMVAVNVVVCLLCLA